MREKRPWNIGRQPMAFWLRISGWRLAGNSSMVMVDEVSHASIPLIRTSNRDSRVWKDSQASRIALHMCGRRSGWSHRSRWSRSSKSWWHRMQEDGSLGL